MQNSEGDNTAAKLTFLAVLLPIRNSAIFDFGITADDVEQIFTENIVTNISNTYLAIE